MAAGRAIHTLRSLRAGLLLLGQPHRAADEGSQELYGLEGPHAETPGGAQGPRTREEPAPAGGVVRISSPGHDGSLSRNHRRRSVPARLTETRAARPPIHVVVEGHDGA